MSMRATTDYISYSYAAVVAFGGVFGYLKAGTLYLYNSTVNRVQGGHMIHQEQLPLTHSGYYD